MIRQRIVNALGTSAMLGDVGENRKFRAERIWYWGLDGKEERDQFVVTVGRGIVFCQVYGYGEDVYIGWDGHLNRGQWVEEVVASGIHKELLSQNQLYRHLHYLEFNEIEEQA